MNWDKGFMSQYYATFVDPETWRDIEKFNIVSGSIKRSDSGLRHSADLTCINYKQSVERLIRIYLDTKQAGSSSHVPLFTGLAAAPQDDINGKRISNPLECYSVLKFAEDVLLPIGYYVPSGVSGAQLVKQLLSAVTPAPIDIIGNSPALSQYIIAENNENYLSMSEKILTAINWRLRLKGDGSIEIRPMAFWSDIKARFNPTDHDSIKPQLKAINDWYSCPNVFRAVMNDTSATARDDSVNSPLSTVNRKREVWMEERDCHLAKNETLAEYSQRRLKEVQRHYLSVEYDRRFYPDIYPSDLIELNYPVQGIDGTFYVTSQSIDINYGAETSEEVVQI